MACDYYETRKVGEVSEEAPVVEHEWVTVSRAASVLRGVHVDTVRNYADQGLLEFYRMAGGHRRIRLASAEALAAVLAMAPGTERDAALEELRRRNQGGAAPERASEPAGE